MMTSSNGSIFRVTVHFCGEFTGHRWIFHTKPSDMELWCFHWSVQGINGWVKNGEAGDLRRHGAHYDVNVMFSVPAHNWNETKIRMWTWYHHPRCQHNFQWQCDIINEVIITKIIVFYKLAMLIRICSQTILCSNLTTIQNGPQLCSTVIMETKNETKYWFI